MLNRNKNCFHNPQAQAQTQEFLFCRGDKLEGMYALPKLNTNSLRQVKGKRANIIASLKKRNPCARFCLCLRFRSVCFTMKYKGL